MSTFEMMFLGNYPIDGEDRSAIAPAVYWIIFKTCRLVLGFNAFLGEVEGKQKELPQKITK